MTKPTTKHDDDLLGQVDAERIAREDGPAWCKANRGNIDSLILTHADADAAQLLEILREQFWTRS